MTDHPAIVALAKEQYWLDWLHGKWRAPCLDELDAVWGCAPPTIKQGYLRHARAAYAAVLRDLIASSGNIILGDEIDNVMSELYGDKRKHPLDQWMIAMLRARAREIGVEI